MRRSASRAGDQVISRWIAGSAALSRSRPIHALPAGAICLLHGAPFVRTVAATRSPLVASRMGAPWEWGGRMCKATRS